MTSPLAAKIQTETLPDSAGGAATSTRQASRSRRCRCARWRPKGSSYIIGTARGLTVRIIAALALALTLAGCASEQQQQQQKMAASLDPYIGQSIAAYVGVRGPPQAVIDLDKNKKMFQWLMTAQSAAVAVPINGIIVARPSQQLECRVSMTAMTDRPNPTLADWIIAGYQWAGSC